MRSRHTDKTYILIVRSLLTRLLVHTIYIAKQLAIASGANIYKRQMLRFKCFFCVFYNLRAISGRTQSSIFITKITATSGLNDSNVLSEYVTNIGRRNYDLFTCLLT